MDVGIRDLKARLSEYLARVEHGEIIGVTSRGKRVAEIVPATGETAIERGLREGWLRQGSARPPADVTPQAPLAGTPSTTELIRADRNA